MTAPTSTQAEPARRPHPLTERELDHALLSNRRMFDAQWEDEVQSELDADDAERRAERRRENKLLLAVVAIASVASAGLYVLVHGPSLQTVRGWVFGVLSAYPT